MDIKHISILLLEDEIDDVDLLKMALDKAPFNYQINHAKDKSSFQSFLENEHHDIIISDHNLPQFSGLEALQIARHIHENIPFILVSGYVGEDEAVNIIVENGVDDFILKDKLGRLNHSILREIKSYKVKCELEEKNKELRELSMIVRQTHNGVIITDADGLVEWVNASTIDLTGYSLKEFVGKKPGELLQGPETNLETKKRIRVELKKRERIQEEILNYRKDRSKYWIKLDISPIYYDKGDFLKFVAIQEDITERKLAEQKLIDNYALSRMAGKIAKLGGWSLNLEDNRVYWSDEVAAIHEMPAGYAPLVEEGIKFYAPEWRDKITEVFTKCVQKGISYDEDMEIFTSSGKRIWVRTNGEAVRGPDGKIVKVQGAFQDITEKKVVEEAILESEMQLRKSEVFNREVLDSLISHIAVVDDEGNIISVNKAWKNFALENDETTLERIGKGSNYFAVCRKAVESGDKIAEEVLNGMLEVKNKKRKSFYFEYPCHSPVEKRWFGMHVYRFEGDKLSLVVAHLNITERKKAEFELVESLKEKETLLQEVHHRVKNNLAVVSGMIQLQSFEEEDENLRQKLDDSISRIQTIASIHELLYKSESFSKLETDKNIEKLVTNIVHTFDTKTELDLHFDLQSISLNINQAIPFSLIINEVVTNVMKHAFDVQKKGTLSVILKEQDKIISIRIVDNGKGLPADFTKFESKNSLGMQLIDTLSDQLNSDYSYRTVDGETQFMLTFEKEEIKGTGNAFLS